MYKYFIVFLISLFFSAFFVPKKEALLRIAGPTIAIAVFMGLSSGLIFKSEAIDDRLIHLVIGSMLFFLIGFMNDLGVLRLWHKVVGQILAVSVMLPISASIRAMNLVPTVFGYLVVFLWFLAVINGLSFLENRPIFVGMLSLLVFCFLFFFSLIVGNLQLSFASLAQAGAIAGFLVYNRFFSRMPLGSCGTMFIGFFIAAISIML